MSDEYFLIAVPQQSSMDNTLDTISRLTNPNQLSTNFTFHIPDLKVGTLDSLVSLSDELTILDSNVENVIKRLIQFFFHDILGEDRNRLLENLVVGNSSIDPIRYITEFQWDLAKYPTKQPLKNLAEIIAKASTHIENELKLRTQSYQSVKQNLESFEKKQTGSLMTRSLNDVLKKENFVLGSEYLKTIVVCVPRALIKDWYQKYERFSTTVVPRSTELITEDNEHAIFTVTLFKKAEDSFRTECRANKFIVRDVNYDEKIVEQEREKIRTLESDREKTYASLVRWLKVQFGELFSASIHIKAIRIFVESVLRYGLPVNFTAILIRSSRKNLKRLHECLSRHYGHLDLSKNMKNIESFDIPGVYSSQQEYYPYVYVKLDLDYVDMKMK